MALTCAFSLDDTGVTRSVTGPVGCGRVGTHGGPMWRCTAAVPDPCDVVRERSPPRTHPLVLPVDGGRRQRVRRPGHRVDCRCHRRPGRSGHRHPRGRIVAGGAAAGAGDVRPRRSCECGAVAAVAEPVQPLRFPRNHRHHHPAVLVPRRGMLRSGRDEEAVGRVDDPRVRRRRIHRRRPSNDSTAPSTRNGPTPTPTCPTTPAQRPTRTGSTTTITTDPTPASVASHLSTASPFATSTGITPR